MVLKNKQEELVPVLKSLIVLFLSPLKGHVIPSCPINAGDRRPVDALISATISQTHNKHSHRTTRGAHVQTQTWRNRCRIQQGHTEVRGQRLNRELAEHEWLRPS